MVFIVGLSKSKLPLIAGGHLFRRGHLLKGGVLQIVCLFYHFIVFSVYIWPKCCESEYCNTSIWPFNLLICLNNHAYYKINV